MPPNTDATGFARLALLARLDARDRALFGRLVLAPSRSRRMRRGWTLLTHLGGARATMLACLLGTIAPSMTLAHAWQALLLAGASHLVVQAVKRTVGRPRPTIDETSVALVEIPDRFSFPSGHACAAMSAAIAIAQHIPSLAVPLLLIALVVGLSRIVLGAHYPGDVLAGQLIALGCAYVQRAVLLT